MTKIILSKPIILNGVSYAECTVEEPTVGATEAYEIAKTKGLSEVSATIALLSVLLNWPEDVIRKLVLSDFKKVEEALRPFIAPLVETGPTPEA